MAKTSTSFAKGTVNNPAGRPKGVSDLAQEIRYKYADACREAMGVLAQYARGEIEGASHGDRLKAIAMLQGRVLGPEFLPPPPPPSKDAALEANTLRVTVTYGGPAAVVVTPDTSTT